MTDRHEGPIGCREENSLSAPDDPIALACDEQLNFQDTQFLRRLQEERPVVEVRTPAGDKAWLITRHDEVRTLLMDRRLGRAHPDPANAPKLFYTNPMTEKLVSVDFDHEPEIRAGLRALLAPCFSSRKMDAFRPKLAPLVADAVARFAGQGPPADVCELSQALTAQVLGELIGVPREDRASLPQLADQAGGGADPQSAASGDGALMGQMRAVAVQKRAEPGEDIMSGVVQNGATDDQAALVGTLLVFAGMSISGVTTTSIGQVGSDLELRDRLIANPELMNSAVEELLRTSGGGNFSRYAREDIEIADVTIRAGDLIVLNYGLANTDKRVFTAPDELDITRSPNPHLAFSHGNYYCLGAPLAKIQLAMTLKALLAALPTLRVADPLEDVVRSTELDGGFAKLLLTW
jgi:cytochrome P450 monooxygenase